MASETNRNERLSPGEIADRIRAELAETLVFTEEAVLAKAEPIGADEIAVRAKAALARITGLSADRVSAVMLEPDGWHVTVDLIELRRIPPATDVLAAYEALFAPSGALMSYRRTLRYLRDQILEES
jgi:hypothetical protein